jgi:hypothetical protein
MRKTGGFSSTPGIIQQEKEIKSLPPSRGKVRMGVKVL